MSVDGIITVESHKGSMNAEVSEKIMSICTVKQISWLPCLQTSEETASVGVKYLEKFAVSLQFRN